MYTKCSLQLIDVQRASQLNNFRVVFVRKDFLNLKLALHVHGRLLRKIQITTQFLQLLMSTQWIYFLQFKVIACDNKIYRRMPASYSQLASWVLFSLRQYKSYSDKYIMSLRIVFNILSDKPSLINSELWQPS